MEIAIRLPTSSRILSRREEREWDAKWRIEPPDTKALDAQKMAGTVMDLWQRCHEGQTELSFADARGLIELAVYTALCAPSPSTP